jgi:uncharacterized protein DUF3109
MFIVGEAVIDEAVAQARFSCDLAQCRGACCTLPGGRGAPLMDSELEELQRATPFAAKYLSEEHRRIAARHGVFEGLPGGYSTVCLNDRDCLFVTYEGSVARCSLEKAYLNGETAWRKPISCHLFPIRISTDAMQIVRYEKIPECSPARRSGEAANVPLSLFLKDALVRRYGEQWYERFRIECSRRELSAGIPESQPSKPLPARG